MLDKTFSWHTIWGVYKFPTTLVPNHTAHSKQLKLIQNKSQREKVETDIMNDDQVFCLKFQDAPLISGSGHKL